MDKNDIKFFIEEKVEEREQKRAKLYLSNEEIEKVNWELISITVKPQDKRCGIVELVLAYVDDIQDIYTVRNSGNIYLNKVYPSFIKRQILSKIKEVIGEKKVTRKTGTRNTVKPTHITIKRNK